MPTQTAELAQLRTTLNQTLHAMANALYPANEAALLSAGLLLAKERGRHITLDAPGKFQLVDGPQGGKSSDKMYCKVAAVGGDTDQQPFTEVLSRIVQ